MVPRFIIIQNQSSFQLTSFVAMLGVEGMLVRAMLGVVGMLAREEIRFKL